MPIPVPDASHLEFVVSWEFNGKGPAINVFHYDVLTVDGATLNQFAAGLAALVYGGLNLYTGAAWELVQVEGRILDASAITTDSEFFTPPAGTYVGTDTANSLPPTDCYTFKYVRPSGAFRHGFVRLPGVTEATQQDGRLSAGVVTAFNDFAVSLSGNWFAYTVVDGAYGDPVGASLMKPAKIQKQFNGDLLDIPNWYYPNNVIFDKIGSCDSRSDLL